MNKEQSKEKYFIYGSAAKRQRHVSVRRKRMGTKKLQIVFAVFAILIMWNTTACSKSDSEGPLLEGDLTKKTVMTVNDEKVTMDTMMYYIMQQEAEYSYNDIYYIATYGTSYWDLEIEGTEEGISTTVREEVQKYVMEIAQMYEIFCQEAKAKGYKLTEEDIDEAEVNAYTIWQSMSDHQKKVTNLTEASLVEIFKKISLATKFYDEVDAGLTIDEDAITKTINKEDYKEYSIEMMCLDKMEEDSEGDLIEVPKKELKAALKRMENYRKKLKNGKTLEKAVSKKEDRIYVQEQNFIEGDKSLDPLLEAEAVKLKNNNYTEIVETDSGYVIMRMIDNAVTESYEQAVANALENAKSDAFEQAYEEVKKSYQVEIKTDIWDQMKIGNLTIDEEEEGSVEVPDASSEQ